MTARGFARSTSGAPDLLIHHDPRLDNNPFFLRRLQADVEKELAAKGFEKTTTARPSCCCTIMPASCGGSI
jgi:hypothetical protein